MFQNMFKTRCFYNLFQGKSLYYDIDGRKSQILQSLFGFNKFRQLTIQHIVWI